METPPPSQKKSTTASRNVLAYFASAQGQAMLEKLQRQQVSTRSVRENSANGGNGAAAPHSPSLDERSQATPPPDSRFAAKLDERLSLDGGNASSTSDHVYSAPCWDGRIPSQWTPPHQHTGAYPGSETSRGNTADVDADVLEGGDPLERNLVSTLKALGGQLSLEQNTSQQTIKPSDASSDDMGLGMLEFGFPFKAREIGTERKPKSTGKTRIATSDPPDVAHLAGEACVRALPNNSRVVLVQDANIDPLDVDERGLPRRSTVVLIADGPYDVPELEPVVRGIPQDVKTPPARQRRHNAMRDSVRFRMKVFHPDYTEKTEFTFHTPTRPAGPKRRVSASATVPQNTKRNRDDDIESPVFSEKQPAVQPEHVEEAGPVEQPIAQIVEEPVEESIVESIDEESIEDSVEEEVEESEAEEEIDEALYEVPIVQMPSPPATPIISPTEELEEAAMVIVVPRIREAVCSPINPRPEEVELPPSPEIQAEDVELPPSPLLLAVDEPEIIEEIEALEEEVEVVEAPAVEVVQSPTPLPSLPGSPVIAPSILVSEPEELAEEEVVEEVAEEAVEEEEEEEDEEEEVMAEEDMKIVPYIPLTPPVTPLSNRRGLERGLDFMPPARDIMQFPPTPSSLMDSPVSIRNGKDREFDLPIFTLPPPPAPSPPPMLQDSPFSSRKPERKVETIKEEDEDEEIEEIIRSPPMSHMPSPPGSPAMSIIIDAPFGKGKELAFPLTQQPSPPASIFELPLDNDEPAAAAAAAAAPEPSPAPLIVRGKERSLVHQPSRLSLPDTIPDCDEFTPGDDSDYYRSAWTTDDLHSRPPTPASSAGTLSRRWSGISRISYTTALTTPPQTRPGSAMSTHPHTSKLLTWNADDFAGPARRDLFRHNSAAAKTRVESRLELADPPRPVLRPRYSLPLIREEWEIRYPLIVGPAESFIVDGADADEYEPVAAEEQLTLLPLTRGVIRRRPTTPGAGVRRRKVRSMIEYTPDETLEGINELFEDLGRVEGAIRAVSESGVQEGEEAAEGEEMEAGEKKKGLLKRLRTRASGLKKKVVDRMQEKSEAKLKKSRSVKGKGKAVVA
ncbi:hypothetical protein EDC01DRAFT_629329 [Geopyxis carbonaria]|nr:hypothetical protein EDC01DRAFT_629329 [Geopyxis carbonaria]